MVTSKVSKSLHSHPCDFCGSVSGRLIFQGGDLLEDMPGSFQFIECDGCGVFRQEPRLDWQDLAEYYQPGYVCHGEQLSEGKRSIEEKSRSLGPKKRVKRVSRYKAEGDWLDVGCGSGIILQAAQEQGNWRLQGVEPVAAMADYTAQRLGIEVYSGTFESFSAEEASFDVITMWDVLEHLASPYASIQHVSKLLKQDGYFLFSTPNLTSLDRKLFGEAWLGYDLPRHLYLFPDQLLRKALKQNGMEVLDRFCFTGSHGAWYLDFAYLNKLRPNRLLGWVLRRGLSGLGFRLLSFLPLRVVDWLKLGTSITYVVGKL